MIDYSQCMKVIISNVSVGWPAPILSAIYIRCEQCLVTAAGLQTCVTTVLQTLAQISPVRACSTCWQDCYHTTCIAGRQLQYCTLHNLHNTSAVLHIIYSTQTHLQRSILYKSIQYIWTASYSNIKYTWTIWYIFQSNKFL